MKKSIFLFFAALLFSASAWADWCGNSFITVNGLWCTGSNSYVHDGGNFHGKDLGTLTTLELGGEFQVWPSSTTAGTLCYKIDDGTENSISLPKTGTDGNNSKHSGSGAVDLSGLAEGSHNIAVWFKHGSDIDNNGGSNFVATFTIAAAGEEPEPVADVTVHFINSVEWAAVACHHWVGGSGTSWPGDVLSKTDEIAGYDVYTATFTGAHTSCIFNNNNNGKQTGDLIVEDGKYYEVNTNAWYADKAAAEAALATPIPDETVYLINTGNWSKVMIHTWNGVGGTAWPGVEMTPTGETIEGYAVYSYTAKQGGQANLLFQESADVNKTGDLEWQAGKYYAPLKNEWYDTKEAAAEALAAPVEYEYVYLINTNDWAAAHIYTWTPEVAGWPGAAMTLEAEQIAGKDVYSYKVVKGTTFGGLNFNCGGDECKTGDLTWEAGKYYAPSTSEWYADAATAEAALAAVVTYDYYIVGSFNGDNPADQDHGMTLDGTVYKATVTLAAGDNTLKVTKGSWDPTWGYTELGAAYEEVSNPNDYNNIKITLAAEKEITVIFDATAGKITFEGLTEEVIEYGVTFNVTVPEGTEACYICGEWDWGTFKPMTKVDDTHYTLTIDDATKDHKYKYTFGEAWTYVEKNADGSDVQDRTWTENDVVAAWADPLATNIYLAGSMTSWAEGKIEFMKETPDATIATVAVELPVGDNTFKIMNGDTWLGNGGTVENSITGWTFKEGDGDCTLKATYAATYVFTWDLTKEDQQLSVTYPTVVTRDYPSVTKSLFNGWRTSYTELDLGNYNTITIYNHDGTAFTYGDDFEVTASLEVNLEGTGSWKVDGDNEVLTATLYNEEKTAIYLITASTAAPKTYTLNCTDAQYASTAYGTVFTGTADGKVLMIDVSMMQVGVNEAFGICSWNDIEISSNLATVTKAGDKYSLTGDFTDAAGNTYKVTITDATPKPATELTVTGATFTESAWGNVEITGVWGSEELGATLGSAEFGDQDWGVEIWTESIYLTPIGSVNFAQADDGVSVVLKGQFSDANANPYNVSITGTLVEYVTPVVEFGDGNNTTAMSDYEWQIVDAKIKRSFVAEDGWYTLCVPFGMDASLIGEAYEITSINKNDKTQGIDVTFSEVDYLLAGNPYLIKPTATVTDPVIEGVEIEYTTGEEYTVTGDNIKITMTGIINGGGTTNGTTEYYVGADGYLYNGEVDKLGLRALFTITDLAGNATRVRARVVTGENATTGVDDTFTTDVPVKAIENGQLIIIRDGVKYNVQGQKL